MEATKITLGNARASVRWLMGGMHVTAPDSYIESMVRNRIANACRKGATCSSRSADALVRYAIRAHRENVDLYRRVMSGRI